MSDADKVSSGGDSDESQQTLIYSLAAERLRARCRWASLVLIFAFAVPFEVVDGAPLFIWSVLVELHPAAVVAALMPVVAGLVIAACARWVRRPSLLGILVLSALAAMSALIEIGSDAAAWDILPLPDNLTRRPESALIALGLSGAAIELSARAETRRAGLWLTALAGVAALIFAFWPTRGEVPIATFARLAVALPDLPGFRLVLGYGLILFIAVMPLLGFSICLMFCLVPERKGAALGSLLVTFALPGTLLFLVFRSLLLTFGDSSLPASIAAAFVLAALLALIAGAAETVALWFSGLGRGSELEQGRALKRSLAPALALGMAALAGQAVLARPPKKGVSWKLGAARADELFSQLLPKWAISHAMWNQRSREGGSAALLSEARAAGRDLLKAARSVDSGLAAALGALISESNQLDLAGRRWFRLVEQVNEASRNAELPYYVDPSVMHKRLGGDGRRLFLLSPYRIEAVRQAGDFALLHVRQLGEARVNHARLGFSRDMQPFALVVLDEIEPYSKELGELAAAEPATCLEGVSDPSLLRCGQLLRTLKPSAAQVMRMTERHELQHQMDGPHLPLSDAVLRDLEGYDENALQEVNRELSAYTAEFTTAGVSAKLGLIHLYPFVFASRTSAMHHVSVLAFETLSERRLRDPRGEAIIELVRAAFDELAKLPDQELGNRAKTGWERLFGGELAPVSVD